MLYSVHMMRKEDVTQVNEIDREAFSTQWPPPNYKHELENQLARYIVTCDETKAVEKVGRVCPEKGLSGLMSRVKRWFNRTRFFSDELASPDRPYIIGFAGIWVMADEAHITNIAVRKCYQRRGVGELMLMHLIDLTQEMKAETMTLEVRVSNTAAQSLYHRYGFTQVGLRRGYYTDNREDALLMSTQNINSVSFQARLRRLKQDYCRRWGIESQQLVMDYPVRPDKR